MMFMGTNITSTPTLPKSLKHADAMFQSCHNLVSFREPLPSGLESGSFLFANCSKLKKAPLVIPGSCKNASFMFTNCESIENTPRLSVGTEYADFMFSGCHKLTEPPRMPQTLKTYDCMAADCPGIDATIKRRNDMKLKEQRSAFIRQMDKPTLSQKFGRAFSAIMQFHAIRQMGYSTFKAPFVVHMMRKSGAMSADFAGGMAALAMSSRKGGMMTMLAAQAAQNAIKHREKTAAQKAVRLQDWDRIHGYGDGGKNSMHMASQAAKDARKGLFTSVSKMSGNERMAYQARYCGSYPYREDLFNNLSKNNHGELTPNDKKGMAKWFIDEMSTAATYYKEGVRLIEDGGIYKTEQEKAAAMAGLRELSLLQTKPLMEMADRMQAQHQLFNDGDIRQISEIMNSLPVMEERGDYASAQYGSKNVHNIAKDRLNEVLRAMYGGTIAEDTDEYSMGV